MPSKKDVAKGKQASVEPDDYEDTGESGGEIVQLASNSGLITATPSPFIPGISSQQLNGFKSLFQGMIATEWDRRFDRLSAEWDRNFDRLSAELSRRFERLEASQSSHWIQHSDQQYLDQYSQPLHQTPQDTVSVSPPAQPTITTTKPEIRAEEVRFFDPEYREEQGATNSGPVVNAGKHVFYRDVYVFVERLKDLASHRNGVKSILTACLRGSALMWYSAELTELERDLLRDADLDRWYTTLINRFKIRTSVALSQLTYRTYGMQDLRNNVSPRSFVMEMLHLAKAAELESIFNQLTMVWNRLHMSLRQHIPEPTKTTSLGQFLDQIDAKTVIWYDLANRPALQSSRAQQSSNQDGRPIKARYAYPPPQRVPTGDGKSHAYLVDIDPDGYGIYEDEEPTN